MRRREATGIIVGGAFTLGLGYLAGYYLFPDSGRNPTTQEPQRLRNPNKLPKPIIKKYPHIYSQWDPRWAEQRLGTADGATIGFYGCRLTCDAMKAGYYGHTITPGELDVLYTNRHVYVDNDLIADNSITQIFPDIKFQGLYLFQNQPADLKLLQRLSADPKLTVTIKLDFINSPLSHFVELAEYDGNNLMIYDPRYGTHDNFIRHYGNNPATTITAYVVYSGIQNS